MKKILFSLVALVCSMSMNAQVMKVMKNGEVVATYNGAEYTVVFEEEPAGSTTTGTAKRTGDIGVNWVQLWENGPKFAEYNVGVTDGKAESSGEYYTWGGSQDKVNDNNTGNTNLTGDNDTATKLWGNNWRMPTQTELEALIANCNVEWTTVNGVSGSRFTGKIAPYNSNSIFLPAAGFYSFASRYEEGFKGADTGRYWSSTAHTTAGSGKYLYLTSSRQAVTYDYQRGYSVRAVLAE